MNPYFCLETILTTYDNMIEVIHNQFHEWHYTRIKHAPRAIIMHNRAAFEILRIHPREYTVPGAITIQPDGKIVMFGVPVIRTCDIDEMVILIV